MTLPASDMMVSEDNILKLFLLRNFFKVISEKKLTCCSPENVVHLSLRIKDVRLLIFGTWIKIFPFFFNEL